MTIRETYNDFKNRLKDIYDARESENISNWVFENVTGLKKWARRERENQLNENQSNQMEKYLQELLQHKPVQYVLNEAWFYKRKFYVNENVLIPRPETEELVEWIIKESEIKKEIKGEGLRILDIGTGSGCIPISLKKELSDAEVTSIDISTEALEVAEKNALNLSADVSFFQVNFLDENEWKNLHEFDVIVSNPPYIPLADKQRLAKNVTDFEPEIALFVADNGPFIFYEKIAKFAQSHLVKPGNIFVEINEDSANKVKEIFEDAGFIAQIKKDIYGKDRMIKASFISN